MSQLTEKELSAIQDILNEEQLLVKKFTMLSENCQDAQLKQQMLNIANKHQGHFNAVYSHLS